MSVIKPAINKVAISSLKSFCEDKVSAPLLGERRLAVEGFGINQLKSLVLLLAHVMVDKRVLLRFHEKLFAPFKAVGEFRSAAITKSSCCSDFSSR